MCWCVCDKAFRGTLTPREGRVCICVFMRNLEKFESKISIHTIFSSHRFFFSKLKQFLRKCSPIVKTYFETILVSGKNFLEDFSRSRITIHIHMSLLLSYWGCHGNPYHTRQLKSLCWGCSEIMIPHGKHMPYWMNRKYKIRRFSSKFGQVHSVSNVFFMGKHDFRAPSAECYVLNCMW